MLFTEMRFLVFFVLIFALYWATPRNGLRKLWLLIGSYAFYAAWDWRFLSLIMISTAVDFAVCLAMPGRSERNRRWLLGASLLVNLGILGFFKYYNFFVASAVDFSAWLGLPLPPHSLSIVLPLGISFYTFQTLSYSIDVYRGRLAPTRSLLDFALFVSFFPQLVAGPIMRASSFLPQLNSKRSFTEVAVRRHLLLFLLGLVKKACVADHIAPVVDAIFASPESYGAASKWLASLLYSLQIYCDFSGYSDMAIGCAGLLGYRLVDNFAFPYLSTSIREFWRRWHISLSTWFRDYLYVPLGGNRVSSLRVNLNLCTVFLLCGLWHGANLTFVIWGLYHGVFLVMERFVDTTRLPRWLGHLYVLLTVNTGFVLFRSPDLRTAFDFLSSMLYLQAPANRPLDATVEPAWWLLLLGFGVLHVLLHRHSLEHRLSNVPDWAFALGLGATAALVLPWVAVGYQPFIYFQF
jgi:alginate O-acetyltransferase complex protein AlgI